MLVVIKAEDVVAGEPRWWYVTQVDAEESLKDSGCAADMLHTADRRAFKREHGWWPKFAIVDRPAPTPPTPGLDLDAVVRIVLAIERGGGDHLGDASTIHAHMTTLLAEVRSLRAERDAARAEARDLRAELADTVALLRSAGELFIEIQRTDGEDEHKAITDGAKLSAAIAAALEAL